MKVRVTLEMEVDTDDYGYETTLHGGDTADAFEIVTDAMQFVVPWPDAITVTCDGRSRDQRLVRKFYPKVWKYL